MVAAGGGGETDWVPWRPGSLKLIIRIIKIIKKEWLTRMMMLQMMAINRAKQGRKLLLLALKVAQNSILLLSKE
jgi:hypothetical protein